MSNIVDAQASNAYILVLGLHSINMVWVSNRASVTIRVTITNRTGGNGREFIRYPNQNEYWVKNHWERSGDETVTIKWDTGKRADYHKVNKNALLTVFDDAVLFSSAYAKRV